MLHMFLSFFLVTLFRQSPSHFETESQSFQFSVKIFSQSALAGGGRGKKFFIGAKAHFWGPCYYSHHHHYHLCCCYYGTL